MRRRPGVSLDDAHELYETVRQSGRKSLIFETSAFHADLHAMRQIYKAGEWPKVPQFTAL
jgi:predicted dehydrogenase